MVNKVHVKKGDTVVVLSGKDRETKGKVLEVLPDKGMIRVEGVNMVTKHVKPKSRYAQGGIQKQEGTIYSSNVMIVCDKCGKPARYGNKVREDGSKVRICKKCGEEIKS